MTITIAVLLVGTALSLLLGIQLLLLPRGNRAANAMMGGLLLMLCGELAIYLSFYLDQWASAPHLMRVLSLFPYMIGPFLLGYVSAMTRINYTPGVKWLLHTVPALVGLVYYMPQLLLDRETLLLQLTTPPTELGFRHVLLLGKYLSIIAYSVYVLFVLAKHRRQLLDVVSDVTHRKLSWLNWLVIVTLAAHGSIVLAWAFGLVITTDVYLAIGLTLVVYLVHWFTIWQPDICSAEIQSPTQPAETPRVLELSAEQIESCRRALKRAQVQSHFYLDPEISIQSLAQQINVPAHHLSHVLNAELGCNFFTYINQLRVEHVKQALSDPARDAETILTIAFDAGFNNKTSFNRVFKEQTGMTPSQFRSLPRRKVSGTDSSHVAPRSVH